MSIGKNIKELRLQHNMSQLELAKIIGVTDKAVSSWENDIKTPRMGTLQRIADYFNIKKSEIIEGPLSRILESKPHIPTDAELYQEATNRVIARDKASASSDVTTEPKYYYDPEVAQMANELKDNPDMRILFDASRGLQKESIEEVVKFIAFQKAKERGDVD